jgi:hypothetical protein
MRYRLPFNKYLVPDKVGYKLTELTLAEDWRTQQLFAILDKRGNLTEEELPRMRRYLHTMRILETEVRMRQQARGYYGI